MPILQVKALPQKNPELIQPALRKTSLAISKFYECDPSNVWVIWDEIKPHLYFEGENSVNLQPSGTHPPIAELLCFEGLDQKSIESLLETTSKALSSGLNLENNIFITYKEAKSGQVIAGNGVVRKKND